MDNLIPMGINHNITRDPFGMITVGRNWQTGSEYRFGFNTQEQDDEVYGNGNLNTAAFWAYDTRLGRRLNPDPKGQFSSFYVALGNNPLNGFDYDGSWFWEKSNVRQARKFAKATGGEFDKWKNSNNGTTMASVTFNDKGNEKMVVDLENESVKLATIYVGTFLFKEGLDYSEMLMESGVGFYESMRANARGFSRVSWALKSADARMHGEQEYYRSGQSPAIIKGIVGLNPVVAFVNASKILAGHVGNWTSLNESVPQDIYGVDADSGFDVALSVVTVFTAGAPLTYGKTLSELAFRESAETLIITTDLTLTGVSFANDSGWFDTIKYGDK